MNDNTLPGRFQVQIGGADLPVEASDALLEITVETSLLLPAVATLVINDPNLLWIDDDRLACGKAITVLPANAAPGAKPLFDGEIVEIEPDLTPASKRLIVRAFDRLHRLARGRQVRSFQNVTDSDLVNQLAREAGLQTEVGQTPKVHEYLLQANQTNLELLRQRVSALGFFLYVEGKTLFCKDAAEIGAAEPPVEIGWSSGLSEFHPRLSTLAQVDAVIVRGWDPNEKQEIVGQTQTSASGGPETDRHESGGAVAQQAFSVEARHLVTDRAVRSQTEADVLARAAAASLTGQFIEADGVCSGGSAATLRAGQRVHISGVGQRFGGTYTVTTASHHYTPSEGHIIRFTVSGRRIATLLGILSDAGPGFAMPGTGAFPFLAVGIVTDNADPTSRGRVKVRFPWLSSEHTSDWSRVAAPGAGQERGLICLPEINDEVLVGFEQGDIHQTYVLGGLWNGHDAPPSGSGGEIVGGGAVRERVWKSRSGLCIALVDTEGSEKITIRDPNGNEIVLDTHQNSLTCKVSGTATVQSQGSLTLESQGGAVNIKAASGVTIDAGGGETVVKGTTIRLN